MPIDVDYRVMSTFLDFYITLVKFVNYKLYLTDGYSYPPDAVTAENEVFAGEYLPYKIEKVHQNSDIEDKYKIDEEF